MAKVIFESSVTPEMSSLSLPSTSGGSTFTVGSNGQVPISNGTGIYWGNVNSSSANLLNPQYSLTTAASTWAWNPWGVTTQKYVWGQSFTDAAISGDTGDVRFYLTPAENAGGTALNMNIDGNVNALKSVYAGESIQVGGINTNYKLYVNGDITGTASFINDRNNAIGGGFKWKNQGVCYGDSYIQTLGTTSQMGTMLMQLGNNKATGTADNARGILQIMSASNRIGLELYGDSEGGNISIHAGNGHTNNWEIDSFDGNLRFYTFKESDNVFRCTTIDQTNGSIFTYGGLYLGYDGVTIQAQNKGIHIFDINKSDQIWMGFANSTGDFYLYDGKYNKTTILITNDGTRRIGADYFTVSTQSYGSTLPSSGNTGQIFFKI